MTDLSLNEHHQELLNKYIHFARYQRTGNIKAMQYAFQNVIESRLLEATYTAEEVKNMLTTLSEVVCGDMEIELINFTHINVLLIQQLCSQAEKWHLRLQIDLDNLQNQELLKKVKAWEQGDDQPFAARRPEKLDPLVGEGSQGPVLLLRQQIETLRQENSNYQGTIRDLKSEVHRLELECNRLQCDLSKSKMALENEQSRANLENLKLSSSHVEEVENKITMLSSSLKETEEGRQEMQSQLSETHNKLQQAQSQLHLAEQELERKFSETATYGNMKKMLAKKNEQMKELRRRLQAYEPEEAAGGEE